MEAPSQDDMNTPATKINAIDVTKPSPAKKVEKQNIISIIQSKFLCKS
jgi:hypothetical protein